MPSKPELPEAEWNFTGFYGPGKEDFRKLLYYYEFGREYYIKGHENYEKYLDKIAESIPDALISDKKEIDDQISNTWATGLPEYDDALEIKTSAAKFIHEVAGEVESELHGRPTGEIHFPKFRENPFCELEEDLQNRLLKSFKRQLDWLTKDRVFLLNHGFQIPSPEYKKKYKGIEKVFGKKWKELEKQIFNEEDENFIWVISQLNLQYDDSIIEKQFKHIRDLLKRVRKERNVKVLNKVRRGKKNYTSDLKSLAAKRALVHYGNFQTAKEKTWGINSKSERGPLYVRNEDWLKTPKIVESVLKELFEKPPGSPD